MKRRRNNRNVLICYSENPSMLLESEYAYNQVSVNLLQY